MKPWEQCTHYTLCTLSVHSLYTYLGTGPVVVPLAHEGVGWCVRVRELRQLHLEVLVAGVDQLAEVSRLRGRTVLYTLYTLYTYLRGRTEGAHHNLCVVSAVLVAPRDDRQLAVGVDGAQFGY